MRDQVIPFFRPSIDETDVASVSETVRSGWLTLGPASDELEREIARYLGAVRAVAVSSCSAAMFLALKAMGIGPSDEVITSALTFASTVQRGASSTVKTFASGVAPSSA